MLQQTVDAAVAHGRKFTAAGTVAHYIPELGSADPSHLGLCLYTVDGKKYAAGDVEQRFTMQSICKVVSLSIALQIFGAEKVFSKVMMEPSGDAFNSIIKLDMASDRPFNPMINCGAIAIIGLLAPRFSFDEILAFARRLCGDESVTLDEKVYHSESFTGDRNRAIAYLLRSKRILGDDVRETLDLYFRLCSLSVTAQSLAGLGLVLANGGVSPHTGVRLLDGSVVRTVKTLMLTCGMYDGSGEFSVRVGIPAKSGVGGGIMGCVESRMGLGTYGPSLDPKGNSCGGVEALEYLSRIMGLHIFDPK